MVADWIVELWSTGKCIKLNCAENSTRRKIGKHTILVGPGRTGLKDGVGVSGVDKWSNIATRHTHRQTEWRPKWDVIACFLLSSIHYYPISSYYHNTENGPTTIEGASQTTWTFGWLYGTDRQGPRKLSLYAWGGLCWMVVVCVFVGHLGSGKVEHCEA